MKPKALLLSLCALLLSPVRPDALANEPVTIFAAASLTDAMTEIGAQLREDGRDVRFSFAASSTLARQIEAGAPAQIFLSANERWMDHLEAKGLIEADSRVSPLGNRLVLLTWNKPSVYEHITVSPDLDLTKILGREDRLVIGDPAHVPAGIYAKQALEATGQFDAFYPGRLVFADNVRAALALVEQEEAAFAIVYETDAAISSAVHVLARYPQETHAPITYPFAVLADQDRPEVRAVFDAITGPAAMEVFARHGFQVR